VSELVLSWLLWLRSRQAGEKLCSGSFGSSEKDVFAGLVVFHGVHGVIFTYFWVSASTWDQFSEAVDVAGLDASLRVV
jgi:hypothetical protein